MGSCTNTQLVQKMQQFVNEDWGYVWGASGEKYTQSVANSKANDRGIGPPSGEKWRVFSNKEYYFDLCYLGRTVHGQTINRNNSQTGAGSTSKSWANHYVADCSGGITAALRQLGVLSNSQRYTSSSLHTIFTERGSYNYNTIPEIPGLCLWKSGHVGIYIGNKQMIEFGGTTVGCRKVSVDTWNWTEWGKIPDVIYNAEYVDLSQTSDTSNTNVIFESKLTELIHLAESHISDNNTWACSKTNWQTNEPWSGAFILACFKEIGGLVNVIYPDTCSPSAIANLGTLNGYGAYYSKEANPSFIPTVGDIVLLTTTQANKYANLADSAALIVGAEIGNGQDSITVIEGDYNSTVQKIIYKLNHNEQIVGFYRPNWAAVGVSVYPTVTNELQPLYDTEYTRKDAILREVAYISNNTFVTIPSGVNVSAINYTSALSRIFGIAPDSNMETDADVAMWDSMSMQSYGECGNPSNGQGFEAPLPDYLTGDNRRKHFVNGMPTYYSPGYNETYPINRNADYVHETNPQYHSFFSSNFGDVAYQIYRILKTAPWLSQPYSNAAIAGILSNIEVESGMNYKLGANGSSNGPVGIVQWQASSSDPRRRVMETFCKEIFGTTWNNTLEGQVCFLHCELTDNYIENKNSPNGHEFLGENGISKANATLVGRNVFSYPNTYKGAMDAGYIICDKYCKPHTGNIVNQCKSCRQRANYAKFWYDSICKFVSTQQTGQGAAGFIDRAVIM